MSKMGPRDRDRDLATPPTHRETWSNRVRAQWRSDPRGVAIDLLRVGIGLIWALNLVFVLDPTNQFISTFRAVALSFAPTTLGGPAVATFVAAHSAIFAWVTAFLTAYLAIAFLFGIGTRMACIVGAIASTVFLLTQFASTFTLPGGTNVGPHPLYLLVYLILFIGGGGTYLSVDRWLSTTGRARFPRLARWFGNPPE